MADVIPNEGLVNMLSQLLAGGLPVKARLFKNNLTVSPDTTLGDFTEADYSGYAPVTITPTDPPEIVADGLVQSQSLPVHFEHNGGPAANSIYGYHVTLETDLGPLLLWASRDEDAPITMAGVGDVYDFDVIVQDTQEA